MQEEFDERRKQLAEWAQYQLNTHNINITVASSDASFRRYFRAQVEQQTYILMDAPPANEDVTPFIVTAEYLKQFEVNVPTIYAKDETRGFLMLTDFGNDSLLSQLSPINADRYYHQAIESLIQLNKVPKASLFPLYDADKLQQELTLFPEWFLGQHLGITPPDFLQDTFNTLISNATAQSQVLVHRDYHSRNLMVTQAQGLGIIDFQDAVWGPITYDLVSLLRDCYVEWSSPQIEQWLGFYHQQAITHGFLDSSISLDIFRRWFDLMGLQRHLKVLGIFCRLHHRDGKSNYLNDLALTLKYVLYVTERYPEFADLNAFLISHKSIMDIL